MEINNLLPAFQTKVSQYAVGVKNSIFTFIGCMTARLPSPLSRLPLALFSLSYHSATPHKIKLLFKRK
jgi:hypothetical protein